MTGAQPSSTAPSPRGCARASTPPMRALGVVGGCALLLASCAVYHAKPLPELPDLASKPPLSVPVSQLRVPGLKPQFFDPAKGLSETNVVTLAVVDNPGLKAARRASGVARAQLLAAGLLPDPQLGGGLSMSSLLTGYNVSLAEDIAALVSRGPAEQAAREHLRQVRLNILWQEWQVAERARELFIESRALAKLRIVLNDRRRLLTRLYDANARALRRGDTALGSVMTDFKAWKSAQTAWSAFEIKENRTRHDLDALLGLAPDVTLRLQGSPHENRVSQAQYRWAVATLAHRRADLLALKAGYHSAEARLREAILAQFPLLRARVTKARSAGDGIPSIGFDVTLSLPIFNHNRGAIALARASRSQLFHDYEAHLDAATGEADMIWKAVRVMRRQLKILDSHIAGFARAANTASGPLERGNLSLKEYVPLEVSVLTARTEAIQLRASLQSAQAVLATILALPPGDAGQLRQAHTAGL